MKEPCAGAGWLGALTVIWASSNTYISLTPMLRDVGSSNPLLALLPVRLLLTLQACPW